MAVNKSEMKLRTVVQFVRVHHSSMEWRCILYLSIEYPIPPNTPNQFKYTNGDVSTLPWSYTLLPLPELLCDGPDSHMAKYYNIPVTTTTPLPSVPINLPNLAMYLQSALDDSRRALNDSSSGLRKLAKMVDGFYPADQPISVLGADDFGDRSLLRRGVKKVFGKANKSTNARGRGGNADTYELVTPFRLDDWG
ncbi:hypothetical protein BD410DRAFT_709722 [Rickenella mellea]|uniref:Uncharacterized protein n=1 Tax=Rickenella mellea TaxID=50990 RepID=A0A4R5XE95_9AGAM|nr:hypothetical protein BD410DRAFT_709722 [Rickenella mellea]